jgi:hypothetical protein
MAKSPKRLDELFHDTLKDIYFAEKKILSTLPKMARAAHSEELRAAFEKHRQETEGHVARLEQVFAAINQKPQGKACAAIVGITDEGAEIMEEYKGSPLAGLWPIFGARKRPFRRHFRCFREFSYGSGRAQDLSNIPVHPVFAGISCICPFENWPKSSLAIPSFFEIKESGGVRTLSEKNLIVIF